MSKEKRHILALNVGSTSIKSRVFIFQNEEAKEIFCWSKSDIDPKNGRKKAFGELFKELKNKNLLSSIKAVGHRVVHGGPMKSSVRINKKTVETIKKYAELAPLHNPYNLEGIVEAQKWLGGKVPQVAVFDTAFFADLPEKASIYPVPAKYTAKYNLHRYGFHGISHQYAASAAAAILKKPVNKLKLITLHLGGGASMSAVKNGVAVDTSMGFTPLEGLVMVSRSGDVDPGMIFYLAKREKLTLQQVEDMLIRQSGIFGMCGSKNMLSLLKRVRGGDKKAILTFDVFVYRIQKYLGAYLAVLGGCDGLVFTGAVGAGDKLTRDRVVRPLKKSILKNIPVMAIKPNEEKMIALEAVSTRH